MVMMRRSNSSNRLSRRNKARIVWGAVMGLALMLKMTIDLHRQLQQQLQPSETANSSMGMRVEPYLHGIVPPPEPSQRLDDVPPTSQKMSTQAQQFNEDKSNPESPKQQGKLLRMKRVVASKTNDSFSMIIPADSSSSAAIQQSNRPNKNTFASRITPRHGWKGLVSEMCPLLGLKPTRQSTTSLFWNKPIGSLFCNRACATRSLFCSKMRQAPTRKQSRLYSLGRFVSSIWPFTIISIGMPSKKPLKEENKQPNINARTSYSQRALVRLTTNARKASILLQHYQHAGWDPYLEMTLSDLC
jgi:hypothetical protein